MMGALKMESSELRTLGQGTVAKADSFDALISRFATEVDNLTANGTWDGDDSDKFATAGSNFKAQLEKASALIREVGENLTKTADNYDSVHDEVGSRISGML